MAELFQFFRTIVQLPNLIQVGALWAVVYFCLRFLRGSLGLGILRGLLFLGLGIYLGAQLLFRFMGFSLPHLEQLLQPSLPILLTGLIVLFQPEIRRAFTRVGVNPTLERLTRTSESRGHLIAEAVERLSRRKIGALIAIERAVGLRGFTEGAVRLNAEVQPALLESLFQPNGPLHDGAVLIRGSRIVAAGCLFPLTENPATDPSYGTRHRAALGVTEETDALAIVVSEETGRISTAVHGQLKLVTSARDLTQRIDELLAAPQSDGEEAA